MRIVKGVCFGKRCIVLAPTPLFHGPNFRGRRYENFRHGRATAAIRHPAIRYSHGFDIHRLLRLPPDSRQRARQTLFCLFLIRACCARDASANRRTSHGRASSSLPRSVRETGTLEKILTAKGEAAERRDGVAEKEDKDEARERRVAFFSTSAD